LILGEIIKRLSAVDWSPMEVMAQTLSARGDRAWDQEAFKGGNFIFALSTVFLPLCAVIAVYLIVCARAWIRLAAGPIFAVAVAFLVTDGSRTPLAIVGGATWSIAMLRWRSLFMRASITGVVLLAIATTFSLIIEFRDHGFESDIHNFSYTYHQDDNYYRALHSFSIADQSDYRWDPFQFFYTIAVNPIPRAIWPDKPLIAPNFFGDFKLWWTTNFFFGESVAMFGVVGGLAFAVPWALLLYLLLYRALSLLSKPMGIIAYLPVTLYVYMCMRSMMSITMFMYLPIGALTVIVVSERISRRRRSRSSLQMYPALSGNVHDRARPRQV
jgi:hypothetical protein